MSWIYIVLIFILIINLISIINCNKKIEIKEFNIEDDKIDKFLKIVFLSDLHNRDISLKLKNIINNIKPDIIICGGDMINEHNDSTNNFYKLIDLIKDYKIYYTYGNHEEVLDEDDYYRYTAIINKKPLILLNSKSTNLSDNITLSGLNNDVDTYLKFGKRCLTKRYITKRLPKIDNKKYNILIAHNPIEFDIYAKCDYDLVLSGHVHGGIIKIPLLGGLLSPDYTFFPKYYDGLYQKENTKMIVSRGLGFSERIKFRIFNTPQVIVINLRGK